MLRSSWEISGSLFVIFSSAERRYSTETFRTFAIFAAFSTLGSDWLPERYLSRVFLLIPVLCESSLTWMSWYSISLRRLLPKLIDIIIPKKGILIFTNSNIWRIIDNYVIFGDNRGIKAVESLYSFLSRF